MLSAPNGATLATPLPDVSLGKAFSYVALSLPLGGYAIQSFDLNSHAPIASVRLPTMSYSAHDPQVIRWGANGIAVAADVTTDSSGAPVGYVIVISGAFEAP